MPRRIDSNEIKNAPTADSSAAAELGDKERWRARYNVEHDRWRGVDVRMISIASEELRLERSALIKRARALQAIDHPNIDTLKDFWADDDGLICVFDVEKHKHHSLTAWLESNTVDEQTRLEFIREYIGILIYARALSASQYLQGLREHFGVSASAGEPRLHLASQFCIDLLKRDEVIAPESEAIEAARAFAKEFGIELAAGVSSLHKLRNSLRDKATHV